ncbi:GrpE nucleotide exchange factor [Punctularia strigosozonata HHB-11173 SS5]|uniref:GrpE nucleotide exchange factor n=1 Tax=Punctularia strigosozonata (strain HHB-11173) TaxID=741275 RepID=UPI000441650F|nr:GrpE nucleotide exchange factor [Punctularia strigosozonata HHB-11173 SS5]EIN07374.1 GrpE nucleotide exchange factor [Punctularia strigosozonata HHB-11173 SS5]
MGARWYSEGSAETQKDAAQPDAASNQGSPASGSADSELAAKLKAKEDEVTDLKSRLQYLQADFLNLQRNSAREKEQTRDFAITKFAKDLIETVDVLGMALKSVPQSLLTPSLDSSHPASSSSSTPTPPPTEKTPQAYLHELYTGVEATQRLLLSTLFKYQIKPFDPTGDKFDPNKHEALYQAPIPGKEPGTVIDCQKQGYMIKERVLRAAQVGVAAETS